MTKSKQPDELDDSMRVLSTGTCDTLSGSSRLTYHIGSMPDGEIYLPKPIERGWGVVANATIPSASGRSRASAGALLPGWSSMTSQCRENLVGGWDLSGQVELHQCNPEIKSSRLISFTSISLKRLVGNLRRSNAINSPLMLQNGNCVAGVKRRRRFSLFSTIATSPLQSACCQLLPFSYL